jgi:hypothetical protein
LHCIERILTAGFARNTSLRDFSALCGEVSEEDSTISFKKGEHMATPSTSPGTKSPSPGPKSPEPGGGSDIQQRIQEAYDRGYEEGKKACQKSGSSGTGDASYQWCCAGMLLTFLLGLFIGLFLAKVLT